MGRNYPRFLYSNPTNTKSPGPFIVHLLPAAPCILRISIIIQNPIVRQILSQKNVSILFLGWLDNRTETGADELLKEEILEDASHWFQNQVNQGFIKI